MPWIWGSLFDCRLKAAVIIGRKKASVNPLKNDNYEKWTTAHVFFCLLSQHLVNYKQKITTSKSKASKTLGISFLHRTQWCNSTLKQHSSMISTSNGKRYLGLSMLNICSCSVLYTVSQRCVAFPDGLVSQMRLLASSMEITSYKRK